MIERTYCQQSYIHQQNLFRSLLLFVRQRVSLRWLCPLVHLVPLRYQIILRKKYRHMFVENRQITDNSEIGRYEQHCSFEKGELRLTFIAALGLFSLFFSFFFFFLSPTGNISRVTPIMVRRFIEFIIHQSCKFRK